MNQLKINWLKKNEMFVITNVVCFLIDFVIVNG